MRRNRKTEEPAMIECEKCGHRGGTRSRGVPAMSVTDLAGKVVRCSRCGHRMAFDELELRRSQLAAALAQAPPSASVN